MRDPQPTLKQHTCNCKWLLQYIGEILQACWVLVLVSCSLPFSILEFMDKEELTMDWPVHVWILTTSDSNSRYVCDVKVHVVITVVYLISLSWPTIISCKTFITWQRSYIMAPLNSKDTNICWHYCSEHVQVNLWKKEENKMVKTVMAADSSLCSHSITRSLRELLRPGSSHLQLLS